MVRMPLQKILPRHVGIILDGNRRWARQRGLPTLQGHLRGYKQAIKIGEHAFKRGVQYLTFFVFSTENWNRTKREVQYLMRLLLKVIDVESRRLHEKGIRCKVIGTRDRLSSQIIAAIERAEHLTNNNTKGTLFLAFNYGGRREIVDAVRAIVRGKHRAGDITEQLITNYLYTDGAPDPDLIIRTSGEQRLSGFLLWQGAYSELYFSPKMWPSFSTEDFDRALAEYEDRQRRFGK